MTRIFICGPCSGLPDLGYPAFNALAARLRAEGHEVSNPAENPEPPCKSWAGYMRISIPQMLACEEVVMLPNWERSEGATMERQIARKLGMPVSYLPSEEGQPK